MSFLDSVNLPGGTTGVQPTAAGTGGSFLKSVQMPSTPVAPPTPTPDAPKPPSFISKVGSALWDAVKWPATTAENAAVSGVQQVKEGLRQGGPEGLLNAGAGVVNTALSPLAPVFYPLSAGIDAAGHTSDILAGLSHQVGLMNDNQLTAYNKAQADFGQSQTAATMQRVVQDLYNADMIAGAVAGGVEGVHSRFTDMNSTLAGARIADRIGPIKTVPVAGESVSQPVSFLNSYIPPEKLPTIQMGAKAPEALPVAETSPADLPNTKAPPGYSYEPVTEPTATPTSQETPPTAPIMPETGNVAPTAETPIPTPKTGEVTKAAADINDTLVRQGFNALPPELQSKYTPESYKEELVKSRDLVETNYPDAVARIAGEKPLGKYEGQILYNEVEREATKIGDGETLNKLAASKLGKELSKAGQTIGAHGFNDNANSAVDKIRTLNRGIEARNGGEQVVEAKRAAVNKDFSTEATKVNLPKEDLLWSNFLDGIQC